MILVDSSVLIDYFNNANTWQAEKFDDLLNNDLIITGDIILLEVLQGINEDKVFEQLRKEMSIFPCFNLCNEDLAVKGAKNFRYLRKKGVTVRKTNDVIIATFCIENEYNLLHNDKDFLPFEKYLGLVCINE